MIFGVKTGIRSKYVLTRDTRCLFLAHNVSEYSTKNSNIIYSLLKIYKPNRKGA